MILKSVFWSMTRRRRHEIDIGINGIRLRGVEQVTTTAASLFLISYPFTFGLILMKHLKFEGKERELAGVCRFAL